jgi:hypothetical protein
MKISLTLPMLSIAALLLSGGAGRSAEVPSTNAPAAPKISREQLREQIKNLPPEERAARLKQWREQNAAGQAEEALRRRELLRSLPPAEREAKLREWRERGATNAVNFRSALAKLTPEQREAKRKEIRQRVESEYDKLRNKEADGTISDEERIRLRRVEAIRQRLEAGAGAPAAAEGGKKKAGETPAAPGGAK